MDCLPDGWYAQFSVNFLIIFIYIRMILRKWFLLRLGKMASGNIIGVETNGPRMVYSFVDSCGRAISGKLNILGIDVPYWERNLHRDIAVYYHPASPDDNMASVNRPVGYAEFISRTEGVGSYSASLLNRYTPILLCITYAFIIGLLLWIFLPIFTEEKLLHLHRYRMFWFIYVMLGFWAVLAAPGFDSIIALEQQCRLLKGFRTTSQKIWMDFNPKTVGNSSPRCRLSYQYLDQTGAVYDGWISPTHAKKWEGRIKDQTAQLEIYYNPANPSEHTVNLSLCQRDVGST